MEVGHVRQPAHPYQRVAQLRKGEFFIDNLLVNIETIWWTGLAPWEFEFPFADRLVSTSLDMEVVCVRQPAHPYQRVA